jgi:Pyridoxamine 5'-phosphate oxidase
MIPERVAEVLQGPAFVQVATRDAALRPTHVVAVGAVVHDDRQTVTIFVPAGRAERPLRNLTANGRIAVGIGLASHEAYQLKGTFVSSRPAEAADHARQQAYRTELLASLLEAGYPSAIARPLALGFAHTPAVAITFRAEEVFLQTPGPGAGTRLS